MTIVYVFGLANRVMFKIIIKQQR